ncbi:MAG: urease accessory UreF family protein, partial [Pseudomonas sp.]|nr:urease accessory UreF family protein [Pseudomonas sp.]
MNKAWQLLRLASPQLPIGGYSYSQGLEMAVDQGLVDNAESAQRWIADQLLLNLARFEAPLLLAHCQAAANEDWTQLRNLAEQQRASRETRELRQESRQMGYSLQQLLTGLPELDQPAQQLFSELNEPGLAVGWALAASGGGGGASDHGLLVGLADDDHPQYHNNARGDARYTPIAPAQVALGRGIPAGS